MGKHKWLTRLKQPFPWTCSCGYIAENGQQAAAHFRPLMKPKLKEQG